MRKIILTVFLLFICTVSFSWRCPVQKTIAEELKQRSAVFIGKVDSVQIIHKNDPNKSVEENELDRKSPHSEKLVVFYISVHKVFKGKFKSKKTIVYHQSRMRGPGSGLGTEEPYIIYANEAPPPSDSSDKNRKYYWTSQCTRTRPSSDLAEIKELTRLTKKWWEFWK